MKIDATNSVYGIKQYYNTINRNVAPNITEAPQDHIDISDEAVSFAEIFNKAKAVLEETDINPAATNIEQMRYDVRNGSYIVCEDQVADAILMYI